MNTAAWVAFAGLAFTIAIWIWKSGRDNGEMKAGIRELLNRGDRVDKRVDSIELRLNDHTERIARLEGPPTIVERVTHR